MWSVIDALPAELTDAQRDLLQQLAAASRPDSGDAPPPESDD